MNRRAHTAAFLRIALAATLAIIGAANAAGAETFTGRVVKVQDGDSFIARDYLDRDEKIRIGAIDAPEKSQPFSDRSRQNLSRLIYNQIVKVEWYKRDKYRRIVGKVLIDGRDAGLEQLRAGLAWHYKQFESEQSPEDRKLFAEAESAARNAHAGLWQDADPIAPWNFKHRRAASAPAMPATAAPALDAPVRGNSSSHIYHWQGCPNYDDVAPRNRVIFANPAAAEAAGYRPARNCN